MNTCKKVCKECPFSRNSLRGYLGPHTLEDILAYKNSDYPFTCHMQRVEDIWSNTSDSIDVCKGYILWATKSAHLFKSKGLRDLQLQVDKESEDYTNVMNLGQFFNHHKR